MTMMDQMTDAPDKTTVTASVPAAPAGDTDATPAPPIVSPHPYATQRAALCSALTAAIPAAIHRTACVAVALDKEERGIRLRRNGSGGGRCEG